MLSLIHPIKDYLILKPYSLPKKKSKIIIEGNEDKSFGEKCLGTILETGPDVKRKYSKTDIIIFNPNDSEYLRLKGEEFIMVKENNIFGILK